LPPPGQPWQRSLVRTNILKISLIVLGFAVVFGLHLGLFCYYLDHGRMGADEGFYAIAARNVMEGEIPYRDFSYTQMPLLPYLNGAMMKVFGFGLKTQRILNIIWSCIGLLAAILALRQRLGRWEPGIVAAFCVVSSPHFVQMVGMGNSHGAATMFLSLATAAAISRFPYMRRLVAFGVFAALAIGCRLSVAPVLAVLAVVFLIEASSTRRRLLAIAVPSGFVLVLLLPFFVADPAAALFNTWEYHLASVFDRRVLGNWIQWWQISPTAIIVLATGLMALPLLIKTRQWTVALLLVAATAGMTVPMIPSSSYGNWITPIVLTASVAGLTAGWTLAARNGSPLRHVVWLLPLLVLFHPLPKQAKGGTSTALNEVAAFIESSVADGSILTSTPIVAVESEREIITGTEMGMFSAMGQNEETRARRLHFTTLKLITDAVIDREPSAIVLMKGNSVWNFKWISPSLRRQSKKAHRTFMKAVATNYNRALRNDKFVVYLPKGTRQKKISR
jgi:hypothetical protein